MSTISNKLLLPPDHSGGTPKMRWWVALSGGMDSCVLLHLLKSLPLTVELRALHINHQISPNANQWQEFCAGLCSQYQIPFYAEKVNVINQGRGIEDAAREERYKIFEHYLEKEDVLLLAHHADDQVETFLLRLMRGAGPRGLSAMAHSRSLGLGILYRPMLRISREEIAFYASENKLHWVEDESNHNDHFNRNYLRNQLLPLLQNRWPEFRMKVQQSAELCSQSDLLLKDLAEIDLQSADERNERLGKSIALNYLRDLSQGRRQNLLRFWLEKNHCDIPELNHINQVESQLINGREDAEAEVNFGGVSLRVFRNRLFALPLEQFPLVPNAERIEFDRALKSFALSNQMTLNVGRRGNTGQLLLKPDLPNLSIRFRQGGERAQPQGRAHSQTLKNLFQEYDLEPWLRHSWPLIYSDDQLVAVAGLWICQGFVAEGESGIELSVSFL